MSTPEPSAAPLDPAILDFIDRFASRHPFAGWVQRASAPDAHPDYALMSGPSGGTPYNTGWVDLVRWPVAGYDDDAGKPFTADTSNWLQVPLSRLPPEILTSMHAGLTQILEGAKEIMAQNPQDPKGWGRIEVVSHLLSQYERAGAAVTRRAEVRAARRPAP